MDFKEASEVIEKALNNVLVELEDYKEGDMLVEWVLVGYTDNPDSDVETYGYPTLYSNGGMAPHRARGLLMTALEHLHPLMDTE